MKIGRKVILTLLASSIVVFVAFGLLASKLVLDGHRELEDAQIRSDVMRAADSTLNEVTVVANKLQDWAVWDDSFEFLQGKGPEFEKRNITPVGFTGLSLCGMVFFDLNGVPLTARTYEDETLVPMSPSLLTAISEAVFPVNVSKSGESVSGIICHQNRTYIVAAAAVVPSSGEMPSSGAIVFVREVNQSLLEQVCKLTKLEVSLFRRDEPAVIAADQSYALEQGMSLVESTATSVTAWTPINDLHKRPALYVKATTPRDILRHGMHAVETLQLVLVGAGVVAIALTWVLLKILVLRRIERVTGQMPRLGDQVSLLDECGSDELGELAVAVNSMVRDSRDNAAVVHNEREKLREVTACVSGVVFRVYLDKEDTLVADFVSEGCENLLGFAAADVREDFQLVFSQVKGEDRSNIIAAAKKACQSRSQWNDQFQIVRGETSHWLCARAVPFTRADGLCVLSGVLYDITESKETALLLQRQSRDLVSKAVALEAARKAAETANKSKSEFLANMSHEIRTPMTAILGYADLLVDPSSPPKDRAEYISTIRRNGEHLLSIINDILDLSKIEADHLVLEATDMAPAQLIEEVVLSLRPRAYGKSLKVETEVTFPIPRTITGDPLRLRQILVNLVGNAIKFTESGTVKVKLGFDKASGSLQFHVIDTGIGLAPEEKARLFQPFTQADTTVSRKFGGTGLGLTISQRLVKLMGGEITIESEKGKGSTFSFALPVGVPAPEALMLFPANRPVADREIKPQVDLAGFGARVLLAEDGPDNQRLISFLLRKAGLSVVVAENGRVAIDTLDRARAVGDRFDLIFMDMQMPILDGYSATRELRAKGVRTPIIALTAHAMSSDRDKCLAAGCDDYATKPIDRGALLALCERYLNHKRANRAA